MREHPQQSVDAKMKQRIRDYRHHERKHQGVPTVGAGTRDNPAKWRVKRVADRNDKLNESGGAAGCHQRQQKSHSQQGVDYPEDVIHDLRDSC